MRSIRIYSNMRVFDLGLVNYLLYYGSEFQAQLDHVVPGHGIICYGSER